MADETALQTLTATVNAFGRQLAHMEGRIDAKFEAIDHRANAHGEQLREHERQINQLRIDDARHDGSDKQQAKQQGKADAIRLAILGGTFGLISGLVVVLASWALGSAGGG